MKTSDLEPGRSVTEAVWRVPRIDFVDACRGLAALAVMCFHGRQALWVGLSQFRAHHPDAWSWDSLLAHATLPMRFGYAGVQLFFVLSGYCIHHRAACEGVLRREGARVEWKAFWARRFWRLYPAYLTAALFTAACTWLIGATVDWKTMMGNLLFLQNVWVATPEFNDPFWSLSVEIHLYLMYPILLIWARHIDPDRLLALVGAISLASQAAWAMGNSVPGLTLALSAWFPWTLGFWLAESEARGRFARVIPLYWIAPAAVCFSLAIVRHLWLTERAGDELFWGGGFGILFAMGLSRWGSARPRLASGWVRALAFCGVISYSLYLLHRPLQFLVRSVYEEFIGPVPAHLGLFAVGCLMSWIVAWVNYSWIEEPLMRKGRFFR